MEPDDKNKQRKIRGTVFTDKFNNFIYICSLCSAECSTAGEFEKHVLSHRLDGKSEIITLDDDSDSEQNLDWLISILDSDTSSNCSASAESLNEINTKKLEQTNDKENSISTAFESINKSKIVSLNDDLDLEMEIDECEVTEIKRKKRNLSFTCDICSKVFTQKYCLMQHMLDHIGPLPKCPICQKSVKYLKPHMRTHYRNQRYKCKICDAQLANNVTLNIHMLSHSGEKSYICSECGLAFYEIGKLNYHIKRHRGLKPHKCDQCDRAYFERYKLRDHVNAVHTGLRPFICKVCNAGFSSNKTLRFHTQTHGEKKYGCRCCDKKFSQAAGRRVHEKRIHGIM